MIRFFDAFAGIGGFRSAFEKVGGYECVGFCEIDKYAQKSYRAMFDTGKEEFYENIRNINTTKLGEFDLLVGGFPCQPFSVAGKRKSFEDAGVLRSYLILCLAISNQALEQKSAQCRETQSSNEKYTFRTWLLRLGLIGDEFKNCRSHLLSHLDGCIAWKNPEDAIAQRERLKQERITEREQNVEPVSAPQEESMITPDEIETATVSDFEEENEESFEMSM